MKTIVIVWGGAAGIMCAATILESAPPEREFHIHLFEKNAVLGKKVSISGGGRCNVTTGITDKKTLLGKYVRGAEFLRYSLGKFWPKKVVEWFESQGVPMKCEDDMRVFPVSNSWADIIGAFEKLFQKYENHITIYHSTTIQDIKKLLWSYVVNYKDPRNESENPEIKADIIVVTTGGNAYSHTGSSGDGYNFARKIWHTVTPLGPSLSSFELWETFPKEISGISLPKARLKWNSETVTDGPMIFTHFGISGPAPFALSSRLAFETIDANHPLKISLAPLAGWETADWDTYLEKEAKIHSNREMRNILEALPRRLVDTFGTAGILPNRILNQKGATLSREDRKTIAKILGEGIPLTIVARRAGDEFVTAGGVNNDEICTETLGSKLIPGLYFAGEVLNIDGVTGGFNLQAAWCTGRTVGRNILEKISSPPAPQS